jgi:hypothetical protein
LKALVPQAAAAAVHATLELQLLVAVAAEALVVTHSSQFQHPKSAQEVLQSQSALAAQVVLVGLARLATEREEATAASRTSVTSMSNTD